MKTTIENLLLLFSLCVLSSCLASSDPYNSDPDELLLNEDMFEGDLFILELMAAAKEEMGYFSRVMALRKNNQWPNAVMPFKISISHSTARKVIDDAMREWRTKTCVTFVPRTDQKNYVEFITGQGGCWSNGVGMNGNGKQQINLDRGCWSHGIVVHEIGHALGFWHEQSRPDRDEYVTIVWDNIKKGLDSQFRKASHKHVDSLRVDYDYESIMHYGRKAFTKNGGDTIVPKKTGAKIGQRSGLSKLDALQAKLLYKCFSTNAPSTVPPRPTGEGPSLGCPPQWTEFNGRCYIYGSGLKNWPEANAKCRELGGQLAGVTSSAENIFLLDMFTERDRHDRHWIGLRRCDSQSGWCLADGDKSTKYFNWATGEPNDSDQGEDCVEMFPSGKWNDVPCTLTLDYICERGTASTGYIQHLQSMMCLYPLGGRVLGENHPIVASSDCSGDLSQFTVLSNGNLQHVSSGMCLHPTGNCADPEDDTEVVLSKVCDDVKHRFVLQENGILMHVLSRTCVRPAVGVVDVPKATRFVTHSDCDETEYAFGFGESRPSSRNLAQGARTAQSSTGHDGSSSRAVDGDRDGDYNRHSCTHTLWGSTPWWRVDLGKQFDVTNVYVANRADCCWKRISNFEITIGNSLVDNGQHNRHCGTKHVLKRGETKNIACQPSILGRYVTIFINGNLNVLSLCEVEVYSYADRKPKPSPDIQGVLQHASSKLCINPKYKTVVNNTAVVLMPSCSEPTARFRVLPDGSLKHIESALCLSPKGGCVKSVEDVELVLTDQCETDRTAFEFTDKGTMMHVMSKTCATPSSEPVSRKGTTMVVLNKACNANKDKFELITAPPVPPTSLPVKGDCGHVLVKSAMVIGGEDAKPGAWPWQVALHRDGRFSCGGSLIRENWVLTAAHCISKSVSANRYSVVLGDHNRNVNENREVKVNVQKFFRHPDYYKPYPINNDVALLMLARPVQLTPYINTVCLPTQDYQVPISSSSQCFITGWGKIRHPGTSHPILQQANLPPVTNTVCQNKLKNSPGSSSLTITDKMLCAGKDGTILSGCHGDSGGPYVCKHANNRWYLQGAVSWGSPRCSAAERYTVFARIAKFRKWVEDTIAQEATA